MKLFGFQRAFHEKPFGWSLRRKPQLTTNTKTRISPRFFICRNVLELRSKPCFKELFEKSPLKIRKNFPQIHLFILAKAFEVPRNFSQKVSCVRVWGRCPNIQHTKKHGIAVLFIFHNMLELPFQTLL